MEYGIGKKKKMLKMKPSSFCQSKNNYYKRLMGYSFWFGTLCLAYCYMFYKDSGLYHEGLWGMKDSLFWKAFLFETPFVLVKLSPTLLFGFFVSIFYKVYQKYSILKEK